MKKIVSIIRLRSWCLCHKRRREEDAGHGSRSAERLNTAEQWSSQGLVLAKEDYT